MVARDAAVTGRASCFLKGHAAAPTSTSPNRPTSCSCVERLAKYSSAATLVRSADLSLFPLSSLSQWSTTDLLHRTAKAHLFNLTRRPSAPFVYDVAETEGKSERRPCFYYFNAVPFPPGMFGKEEFSESGFSSLFPPDFLRSLLSFRFILHRHSRFRNMHRLHLASVLRYFPVLSPPCVTPTPDCRRGYPDAAFHRHSRITCLQWSVFLCVCRGIPTV